MSEKQFVDIFNGRAVKMKMEYPDGLPDVASKFPSFIVEQIRDRFEIPHEVLDKDNCPVLKLAFDFAARKSLKVNILQTRDEYTMAYFDGHPPGTRNDRFYIEIGPDQQGVQRIERCYIG